MFPSFFGRVLKFVRNPAACGTKRISSFADLWEAFATGRNITDTSTSTPFQRDCVCALRLTADWVGFVPGCTPRTSATAIQNDRFRHTPSNRWTLSVEKRFAAAALVTRYRPLSRTPFIFCFGLSLFRISRSVFFFSS